MKVLIQVQARRYTDVIAGRQIAKWVTLSDGNYFAWMNGEKLWLQDDASTSNFAIIGDYIVKDPSGGFFICSGSLFEMAVEASAKEI